MEQSGELDVRRYLRLIYRKRVVFALTAMAVATAVVFAGYLLPKVYEAKSIIFIERNVLNDLIKNVTVAPNFEEKIKALSIVMKSRSLLVKVLGDLDLDINNKNADDVERMLKSFQDKTDIKVEINKTNRKDMELFIVSFSHSDPKLASNYVNTLVRRYIEENLSLKREEAYGANRFLVEQINLFKEKLARTESEIAMLRKDKHYVVNERMAHLQKKLSDLLSQYTENHPDVVKIRAEIEQLREHPAGGKEASRSNGTTASARNRDKKSPLSQQEASLGQRSLLDLEREREINKKIYEELLATLGKSEVSTQVEVQDKAGAFRIIDPAIVPTKPVSPNIIMMILFGILGGLAAGVGLVVVLDMLDSSIRSIDTVKRLGMPVLAIIPSIQTTREMTRTRTKDRWLYAVAGVYLACLLSVAVMEAMGFSYIDDLFAGTKTGIKSAVRKVL